NVLPLLSADAASTLAKVIGHIDALSAFITSTKAAIPASPSTLQNLIGLLNSAPTSGLFTNVDFSTSYRGASAGGALEVFVDIALPTATTNKSIPLDLGPTAT